MISGMRVRRRSSAGGKKGYKFYRYLHVGTVRPNMRINEFRLVTVDNPTGVPTGGTPTASHRAEDAALAFDGNTSTYWFSGAASGDVWLQYEYPKPVEVIEYRLWSNGTTPSDRPANWLFQASVDGIEWVTIHERSGSSIPFNTWAVFPL